MGPGAGFLVLGLGLRAVLVAGQSAAWGPCDPASCLDLQILYTSKLMGSVLPVTSTGAPCDPDASSSCFGGTARRVAYVEKAQQESTRRNSSTLFVDLGGSSFGGPLNGHPGYPLGVPESVLLNMTPYDVCVFGTRDFMTDDSDAGRAQMAASYATRSCPTVLSNARLRGPWEAFGNKTKRFVIKPLGGGWKAGVVGMMTYSSQYGYTYGPGAVDLEPDSLLSKVLRGAANTLQVSPVALKSQIDTFTADPKQMDPYYGDVMLLSTILSVGSLAAAEAAMLADPDVNVLILLIGDNRREDQVTFMAEHGPFDIILRETWPGLGATPQLVQSKVFNKTVLIGGSATVLGLGSLRARIQLGRGVERFAYADVPLNASVPSKPDIQAAMSSLYDAIRQRNTLPYGHISNPLTGGHRGGETPPSAYQCYTTDCPAGNTLGRALLWKARAAGYRADLSLSNLGSLRAPMFGANGTVYISHCRATNAFQNTLGLYTILGKDLYANLKNMMLASERGFVGAGIRAAFHEPCFRYVDHTNYSLQLAGPPGSAAELARCAQDLPGKDNRSIVIIDAQVQMVDWDSCANLTSCPKSEWRRLEKGTTYTVVITDFFAAQLTGFSPVQVGFGPDAQAVCDFIAASDPVQVESWEAFRDRGAVQYASPEEGWAAGNRVPSVKVNVSVLDGAPTCSDGMFLPDRARACVPCAAGSYSTPNPARDKCDLCPQGFFGDAAGRTACAVCPAGFFTDTVASTACRSCQPGSVSDQGAFYCNVCKGGTYSATVAADRCTVCEVGRFVDGDRGSACIACGAGLVTMYPGATKSEQCICPEGRFRPWDPLGNCTGAPCGSSSSSPAGSPACLPCPEGMECPAGSDMQSYAEARSAPEAPAADARAYPRLRPSFWSDPSAPLYVFRCASASICPGGEPGTCSNAHTFGTSCALCASAYYSTTGGCRPCRGADATPALAVLVGGVLLAALLAFLSTHDTEDSRFAVVTVGLTAGQLVCTVQMLGVVKNFHMVWQEPIASLLQAAGLLAFDLDLLKVQCLFGKDSPVGVCLVRLLALPFLGLVLGFILLLVARVKGRAVFDYDRYVNALGLLFVMLYVSITVAMVSPLRCTAHPNGRSSMTANLAVMCWESKEHTALVAMSIVGFLIYPILMLSRVALVTWQYPAVVACGRGSQLLRRFRFLFARFRPDCYFWGFWYLLRNLLLPLIPVAVANDFLWQIFLAGLLLQACCCFQVLWGPWRTTTANYSEVASLLALLIFIETASFLSDGSTDTNVVSQLLFAIMVAGLSLVALMVLYGVYRLRFPGKQYNVFLSHHKDGAGTLARWFKMLMTAKSHMTVFLDSDELDNLDLIVDVVRCRTGHVVLLLTKLTLTRLWCAAEIAAAVAYKVPMVPVQCCDFTPPDEAFMDSLPGQWTRMQLHALEQYGITLQHVDRAYQQLATMPSLVLMRFGPLEEQEHVVSVALQMCGHRLLRSMSGSSGVSLLGTGTGSVGVNGTGSRSLTCQGAPVRFSNGRYSKKSVRTVSPQILIIGASSDAEARTASEVLQLLLVKKTGIPTAAVHDAEEAEMCRESAEYLLVVLTRGALRDPAFEEASLALMAPLEAPPADVQIVTVLADTNFPFPSPEFYAPMEAEGFARASFALFLRRIFNILALPFSPYGSTPIIDVQVSGLCQRLRPRPKATQAPQALAPLPPAAAGVDTRIGKLASVFGMGQPRAAAAAAGTTAAAGEGGEGSSEPGGSGPLRVACEAEAELPVQLIFSV